MKLSLYGFKRIFKQTKKCCIQTSMISIFNVSIFQYSPDLLVILRPLTLVDQNFDHKDYWSQNFPNLLNSFRFRVRMRMSMQDRESDRRTIPTVVEMVCPESAQTVRFPGMKSAVANPLRSPRRTSDTDSRVHLKIARGFHSKNAGLWLHRHR